RLGEACDAFEEVARFIAANTKADPNAAFAGSVPYLMLAGNLVAGWQMGRALLKARALLADGQGDAAFLQAKAATARFYAEHILVRTKAQRDAVVDGASSVTALALDAF
ncbi:acyl-CoA dehydrogenase, partial [Rhizobium leguminosarum]|uniref:acyl-CoA dehydrogenase C-terminal domain-containing protein n=1 Tax=Rhizobium ruizarguesonis TaxID=2081791 RepID=UPI0014292FCA